MRGASVVLASRILMTLGCRHKPFPGILCHLVHVVKTKKMKVQKKRFGALSFFPYLCSANRTTAMHKTSSAAYESHKFLNIKEIDHYRP
jgi:hypothetical protein